MPRKALDADRSPTESPLTSLLDDAAAEHGDLDFTIFNDGRRTFAQVKDTADRIAGFLRRRGLEPGDRAAVVLPNIPQYPEIIFGILQAGGVCVPLSPLQGADELAGLLQDTRARALFCMDHPALYPAAVQAVERTRVHTVVVCSVASYLPRHKALLGSVLRKIPKAGRHEPDHILFDRAVAESQPEPPEMAANPAEDPAVILTTSGTTGPPKATMLSHANLAASLEALRKGTPVTHEPDAQPEPLRGGGLHGFLGVQPWSHGFGLVAGLLLPCRLAARLVCIPDPRAGLPAFTGLLMAIKKYRCTALAAEPAIYAALASHAYLERFDLSSLAVCWCSGGPLPEAPARRFEEAAGAVILETYGLTEASGAVAATPPDPKRRSAGTAGFPLPGTEVAVVDLEHGTSERGPGQEGEIAVRGPQVMLGYLNRPQATEAAFRVLAGRRFLLTGDIGRFEPQGSLKVTDRKEDIIVVQGSFCFPREVEEVLQEHPTVARAAVIGVPDQERGQAAKAYVELLPGGDVDEEELIEHCSQRLASFKTPCSVVFSSRLPLSPTGQVSRRALRGEEMEGH